jgi:hypothetical protein
VSVVHTLLSLQITGVPGLQTPPPHVSPLVQAFPSSQATVLFVKTHPVAGLHASSVQMLLSLQFSVPVPGWQLPPPQVSPIVQAFPSSQAAVLFVKTQPVAGLHESSVHTLLSSQTIAVPLHTPPLHVSPLVHALPSSHACVLFVKTHPVAGLHASVVHTLLSLQTIAVPLHEPPPHVSPLVQASPSSHETVLFVKTQPVAGLHVSVVHTLLSLQFSVPVPGWQLPPPQVSPIVQAFPSSQAAVLFV